MGKRIKKHIKNIFSWLPKPTKEKIEEVERQFPLNVSDSDRITWKVEVNKKGTTVKICNVSYEVRYNNIWEWVVRYDDHGGSGTFHRHERISLQSESDTPINTGIRQKGSKRTLTQWAIDDIRNNYLTYRKKFMKKSSVALY